jgi:hypothetical protein
LAFPTSIFRQIAESPISVKNLQTWIKSKTENSILPRLNSIAADLSPPGERIKVRGAGKNLRTKCYS